MCYATDGHPPPDQATEEEDMPVVTAERSGVRARPNRLRIEREKSRLTQQEVATILGVDVTTVNKHESSTRELTPEMIRRYSRLYKVDSYALFVDPESV